MGKSLHAGQVCVADGTPEAGERIRRTLLADPGMGVIRHADAGYPEAIDAADRLGVRIPMRDERSPSAAPRRCCARPRTDCRTCGDAADMRLEPGSVTVERRPDRGARRRPERRPRDRRRRRRHRPGLRRLPHAPAVRRLARAGVRGEGHRRPVRGDRRARRRDRELGARAGRGERRRGAGAGARRARARCSPHGTTTFEAKTGYGLSREGELRARAAGAGARRRPRHRPVRPLGAGRLHARRVDGRGRRAGRRGATSTRSTSTSSRSPSATRTSRGWARSRAARACPLRAHVEQFNANRSVPVALRGRRAVGRPPRLPAPGRPRAAGGRRVRGRAPARRRVPRRRGDRARPRAGRRGRDLRAGHRLQPRHVAGRLAAGRDRAGRAPLRLDRARGAAPRARSTLRGCCGLEDRGSIEVGKRADLVVLDAPVEHIAYRFGHNPVRSMIAGGEFVG